ncbi:MAG: methyltransferase domain-containing protein [Vicinamibacterales bacterium]
MKSLTRLVFITVVLMLVGTGVAITWLLLTTNADWRSVTGRIRPVPLVLLIGLTAVNILVRFVRWQYLLRRVDVRLPTRPSLAIYLASLAAIVTPAYIGETVRAVFAKRRFGVPPGRTLTVLIGERGLDVFTLALLTAVTATDGATLAIALAVVVVMLLLGGLAARLARAASVSMPTVAALTKAPVVATAGLLSLAAWLSAGALVTLAAQTVAASVPLSLSVRTFSSATLLGGLSLMPAGVGATGSVAIVTLTRAGLDVADAVLIVSVLRLATVGLTFATGLACLVSLLRRGQTRVRPGSDRGQTGVRPGSDRGQTPPVRDSADHFDEIADVYRVQLPGHIRDLLVSRKTDLIAKRLGDAGQAMIKGLDLGCGQGAHALNLAERGYQIVGVDPSIRSVELARAAGARVSAASASSLPFVDQAFDFVYVVGVLHHVPSAVREQAYGEIRRVLKPGGLLLVHETNPRNPLFRFYMGYVFPIVRRIDEGTEEWLDPRTLVVPGMEPVATDYVTFLPDFLPHSLLAISLRLEERLQNSRFRMLAAHYLVVLRNED